MFPDFPDFPDFWSRVCSSGTGKTLLARLRRVSLSLSLVPYQTRPIGVVRRERERPRQSRSPTQETRVSLSLSLSLSLDAVVSRGASSRRRAPRRDGHDFFFEKVQIGWFPRLGDAPLSVSLTRARAHVPSFFSLSSAGARAGVQHLGDLPEGRGLGHRRQVHRRVCARHPRNARETSVSPCVLVERAAPRDSTRAATTQMMALIRGPRRSP